MAQPREKDIVAGQVFEVAKEANSKKKSLTAQEASALVATIKGKQIYLKSHPDNLTEKEALKKLMAVAKEYGMEID